MNELTEMEKLHQTLGFIDECLDRINQSQSLELPGEREGLDAEKRQVLKRLAELEGKDG